MTLSGSRRHEKSDARVLVLSMSFVPCRYVGGKRFAYLSKYLSGWCSEYHIVARRERDAVQDRKVFRGNVHRVKMFPYYPPRDIRGRIIRKAFVRAFVNWFCLVDPDIGWVGPATREGIYLCKKYQINVVIVTVPSHSALIAATIISKVANAKLIIDYRDPWTNYGTAFPKPFGKWLCPAIERWAIMQSSAVVVCSDILRDDFIKAFGDIGPARLAVIYNAFEVLEKRSIASSDQVQTTMLFAGVFYQTRRLSVIAPVLAEMLRAKEICKDTFRFHLYTQLNAEDYALIKRLGIGDLIQVHPRVPHEKILEIMQASDILFLPSGSDVSYAVPYKFFDYLSARRPILAVAPKESSVDQLMRQVDCGEFAELGNRKDIGRALSTLIRKDMTYTYAGSERFRWENAAKQYIAVIDSTLAPDTGDS